MSFHFVPFSSISFHSCYVHLMASPSLVLLGFINFMSFMSVILALILIITLIQFMPVLSVHPSIASFVHSFKPSIPSLDHSFAHSSIHATIRFHSTSLRSISFHSCHSFCRVIDRFIHPLDHVIYLHLLHSFNPLRPIPLNPIPSVLAPYFHSCHSFYFIPFHWSMDSFVHSLRHAFAPGGMWSKHVKQCQACVFHSPRLSPMYPYRDCLTCFLRPKQVNACDLGWKAGAGQSLYGLQPLRGQVSHSSSHSMQAVQSQTVPQASHVL